VDWEGMVGTCETSVNQSINRAAMVKSTIHAIISDAMAKSMIRVVLNKIKRIDTSLIMLKIN
jgi:hypothetical protein